MRSVEAPTPPPPSASDVARGARASGPIQGATFREGAADPATGKPFVAPADGAGLMANVSYWEKISLSIPWSAWIKPLFYWLILVFGCYGMFYFLTYVVLGYWSEREKLIFPLAKLPESLLPAPDSSAMPPILRTPGFWAGFVLARGSSRDDALANAARAADLIHFETEHAAVLQQT